MIALASQPSRKGAQDRRHRSDSLHLSDYEIEQRLQSGGGRIYSSVIELAAVLPRIARDPEMVK